MTSFSTPGYFVAPNEHPSQWSAPSTVTPENVVYVLNFADQDKGRHDQEKVRLDLERLRNEQDKVKTLLFFMFVFFLAGLGAVALAPLY